MFQEQAPEKATTVWAPCATQTEGGCRPRRAETGRWHEGEARHSGHRPGRQRMPSCVFRSYSDLMKTWAGTPYREDQRFFKIDSVFCFRSNKNLTWKKSIS